VPALWIGTSGYVYHHWRSGVFYPPGLRAADELAWYATRFRTVELNHPFYRVPTSETVARWRDSVPEDFLFAVKVNREISHRRMLRDAAGPLGMWAGRLRAVGRSGKDVYVYFNNDREGHAPRDAARLRELLRVER
jgi:uncharacterized protein YecE (DUF72 family)